MRLAKYEKIQERKKHSTMGNCATRPKTEEYRTGPKTYEDRTRPSTEENRTEIELQSVRREEKAKMIPKKLRLLGEGVQGKVFEVEYKEEIMCAKYMPFRA